VGGPVVCSKLSQLLGQQSGAIYYIIYRLSGFSATAQSVSLHAQAASIYEWLLIATQAFLDPSDPPHERRHHSPDDHEQPIPIVMEIQPPGYRILIYMGHTAVPLLPSYQRFQPPEMGMASLQPHPPLPYLEEEQQSYGAS